MIELTLEQMMVVSGGATGGGGKKGSGDGDTSCVYQSLRDAVKGMDYGSMGGVGAAGGGAGGGTGGIKQYPICED